MVCGQSKSAKVSEWPLEDKSGTSFIGSLHLLLFCCYVWLTHGFLLGENVTLLFTYTLIGQDSQYHCNVHLYGADQPFVISNVLIPSALKPGQDGRFEVQLHQTGNNLTVVLTIHDLQIVDEGLYIVNVLELLDGHVVSNSDHKASVEVTYTPGKAQCGVQNPSGSDWQMVHCNATVGSDGSGALVCHQNFKRLPLRGDVTNDGASITATYYYWSDPKSPVQCCSMEADAALPLDSCDDVVFQPAEEVVSSTHPPERTSTLSPYTPSLAGDVGTTASDASSSSNLWMILGLVLAVLIGTIVVHVLITVRRFRRWKRQLEEMERHTGYGVSENCAKMLQTVTSRNHVIMNDETMPMNPAEKSQHQEPNHSPV